jgi:hypothetical protein
MHKSTFVFTLILLNCFHFSSNAQTTSTVVPFLNMLPDARSAALGETGAATSADANSTGTNPAKIAFIPAVFGISASYSPWLRRLVPDMNLGYVSAFYKVDVNSAIAGSLRYFSVGKVQFTNAEQQDMGTFRPADIAADLTYSREFGEAFSLGTTVRYISSTSFIQENMTELSDRTVKTVAADVSAYFVQSGMRLFGYDADLSAGVNISNIGAALRFADDNQYYLPTNLKIGVASAFAVNDADKLMFTVDINKLLVVPQTSVGAGVEFVYHGRFALRSGYVYEPPKFGNRRYLTLGGGLKYEFFQVDFAYILADVQKSPMANTLRFTLMFNFGPKE